MLFLSLFLLDSALDDAEVATASSSVGAASEEEPKDFLDAADCSSYSRCP